MASDWNEELDKYENGRRFGDDLRDSIRTVCSAGSLIVSKRPRTVSERTTGLNDDGWINGSLGWGNYVNGEKMEYDSDD